MKRTGDPRTCSTFQAIVLCKYCDKDSKCGEIISAMTTLELKELYSFLTEGD